jgi:hypothetical protein
LIGSRGGGLELAGGSRVLAGLSGDASWLRRGLMGWVRKVGSWWMLV